MEMILHVNLSVSLLFLFLQILLIILGTHFLSRTIKEFIELQKAEQHGGENNE